MMRSAISRQPASPDSLGPEKTQEETRSGERRGGEEGRSWWAPDYLKKKKKSGEYTPLLYMEIRVMKPGKDRMTHGYRTHAQDGKPGEQVSPAATDDADHRRASSAQIIA